MTVSCRIGLVLAFLVALLSPASAGKKIVGLNFQPRHSSNVPCLFQPFFVAQQSDPFYKDLKEVKTKRQAGISARSKRGYEFSRYDYYLDPFLAGAGCFGQMQCITVF